MRCSHLLHQAIYSSTVNLDITMKRRTIIHMYLLLLATFLAKIRSRSSKEPRPIKDVSELGTSITSEAGLALFSPSILSAQIPMQVYFSIVILQSIRERFSACPTALSFFGTKDTIPSRFCIQRAKVRVSSLFVHCVDAKLFPTEAVSYTTVLRR